MLPVRPPVYCEVIRIGRPVRLIRGPIRLIRGPIGLIRGPDRLIHGPVRLICGPISRILRPVRLICGGQLSLVPEQGSLGGCHLGHWVPISLRLIRGSFRLVENKLGLTCGGRVRLTLGDVRLIRDPVRLVGGLGRLVPGRLIGGCVSPV